MSHRRTVPSDPADASCVPSGLNARSRSDAVPPRGSSCPNSVCSSVPSRSTIEIRRPSPIARRSPSGCQASSPRIGGLIRSITAPVPASQRTMPLVSASIEPSGDIVRVEDTNSQDSSTGYGSTMVPSGTVSYASSGISSEGSRQSPGLCAPNSDGRPPEHPASASAPGSAVAPSSRRRRAMSFIVAPSPSS